MPNMMATLQNIGGSLCSTQRTCENFVRRVFCHLWSYDLTAG